MEPFNLIINNDLVNHESAGLPKLAGLNCEGLPLPPSLSVLFVYVSSALTSFGQVVVINSTVF